MGTKPCDPLHIITLPRAQSKMRREKDRCRRYHMIQAIQPSPREPGAAFYPSSKTPPSPLHRGLQKSTRSPGATRNLYTPTLRRQSLSLAMPPLSGYQNICDFIACAATHAPGAIKNESGTSSSTPPGRPRNPAQGVQNPDSDRASPSPHPPFPTFAATRKKKRLGQKHRFAPPKQRTCHLAPVRIRGSLRDSRDAHLPSQ